MAIAVLVSASMNILIKVLSRVFSQLERHHSFTDQEKAVSNKLTAALAVNMVLLTLALSADVSSLSGIPFLFKGSFADMTGIGTKVREQVLPGGPPQRHHVPDLMCESHPPVVTAPCSCEVCQHAASAKPAVHSSRVPTLRAKRPVRRRSRLHLHFGSGMPAVRVHDVHVRRLLHH